MALINVPRTDTFSLWRQKFNELAIDVGDLDLLLPPCEGSESLVEAINRLVSFFEDNSRDIWIRSIAMN